MLKIFAPVEKKPSVKIFENCSYPSREKNKTPHVKKSQKSVRENFGLHVKRSKKVSVKATLPSAKKT